MTQALSLAEMHERLGRFSFDQNERRVVRKITDRHGNVQRETVDRWADSPLRGIEIDNYIRDVRPVEVDDTAFVRALQADWDETGHQLEQARRRYSEHRRSDRYLLECREIIAREDAINAGIAGGEARDV